LSSQIQGKVRQMPNPLYEPNESINERIVFHNKIFLLSATLPSTLIEYEKLIASMFPFSPTSNLQINPIGSGITKSWNKNGDLLIHVEWIEYVEDKVNVVKSTVAGIVSQIDKEVDGSYDIYIEGKIYEVPPGLTIHVKKQDRVVVGQIIAGTDTPKADTMNY
jgi:hypothetical protein